MINKENNMLDNLFTQARDQKSKVSFEEMANSFEKAAAQSNNSLSTKTAKSFTNSKITIIMLSITSIAIVSSIFFWAPESEEVFKTNFKDKISFTVEAPKSAIEIKKIIEEDLSKNTFVKEKLAEQKTEALLSDDAPTPTDDKANIQKSVPTSDLKPNTPQSNEVTKTKEIVSNFVPNNYTTISMTITETSTVAEIEAIKAEAIKAGIIFNYDIKFKKDKIKMLAVKMSYDKKGEKKTNNYYFKGGRTAEMSMDVSWREDQNGQVIDFNGNGCTKGETELSNKDKSKLKGNGNVVKKTVEISSFSELELSGVYDVILTQDGSESVIIETDENLHQIFKVENKGTKLIISTKEVSFKKPTKINVYVSVKTLNKLTVKNVGDITCSKTIQLGDLDLQISNVGNSSIDIDVQNLEVTLSAVGNVQLKGKAIQTHIKNSAVGNVDTFLLNTQKMNLENSGIGNVQVSAEKEFIINTSGIGNLMYKGNAEVKTLINTGLGNVSKY